MTLSDQGGSAAQAQAYQAFEHAAWESAATRYSGSFARASGLFIDGLLDGAGVRSGHAVLDVACGPGLISAAIAQRGAVPIGVDFSAAMVAEASRQHPSIAFRQASADALPFEADRFDAVAIGFGVHHFAYPVAALSEARRVLKPGGTVAFTVWSNRDHLLRQLLLDAVRAHGIPGSALPSPPHGDLSTGEQCTALLSASGFAPGGISARKLEAPLFVETMSAVVDMMAQGTARTRALLAAQPADAMAGILRALEASAAPYKTAGGYSLPAVAVLATAVKS